MSLAADAPAGRLRAAVDPPRRRTLRQLLRVWGHRLLIWTLAFAFVAFSLLPLAWGVSTALKTKEAVYAFPPVWIPSPATLENFAAVFANPALFSSFLNTLVIALATTAIALVVGVLGAYGFSRYRFPGRDTLLWSLLFTKLFPRVVVIVPFFVTLRWLDLMNTYPGLVLVYLMAIFPVAIWMLKGFFDNIPIEIEEAAIMDGCSLPQLLWLVVIPISRPALAAVAMYSFIIAWNEFLFALVFTNGLSRRPLSVALAFFIDENGIRWGELMAASIVMSLPALVVFSIAQKMLVRGLSEGAVKG
ncbi:carbohydrate ABC transporter permease [Alsobacter sp. SYSU M60028]|uniref:Maltose/maltodextrin transport system permease protein MalG n=1 Tax=Alsobacter ponti TaxID=2962936 RepID=A0ABT1LC57_9HYPH|nr:carbohydrate ABC transporter permease [Alsobacter ponti]MCP8938330.1 carbohydrate ABC transporter permease [Alsobacter ponti]